ncbi:hypothetical protein OSTOST_22549 [Ostertagia ostertagi]
MFFFPENRSIMPQLKNLLNAKVVIPVAGVLVLLIAATLVTIFYIRNPTVADGIFAGESSTAPYEGEHHSTDASKSGGVASHAMAGSTSAPVLTQTLTTILATSPTSETTTASISGEASDPNLDSSSTMHAIEPTKRE